MRLKNVILIDEKVLKMLYFYISEILFKIK